MYTGICIQVYIYIYIYIYIHVLRRIYIYSHLNVRDTYAGLYSSTGISLKINTGIN